LYSPNIITIYNNGNITMSGIFIVAAKRTPFGAFGGLLKSMTATQLGVVSTKAALAEGNIDPSLIDHVFFGNVIPSSKDAAYLARHVGLQSGIPITTPALTLNRLCGSGFETVAQGANLIKLGEANMVVCGGTESMSRAPLQANGLHARWGIPLGEGLQLEDALWSGLTDAHSNTPMGMTAENLAKEFDMTRQQCDEYAIRSQQTWAAAQAAGVFAAEMAPVEIVTKKGSSQYGY
jgi:acetyl-CoA acyltransferase 2